MNQRSTLLKFPDGDGKRGSSITEWQCSADPIIISDSFFILSRETRQEEKKRKDELEMREKRECEERRSALALFSMISFPTVSHQGIRSRM